MTENQLGDMQMMEDVAEHKGMNYSITADSRYVAQPFYVFLFSWEEGSVDNPITNEEDEGFSEPRTPVSEPPKQSPATETTPAFCTYEKKIITIFACMLKI